MVVKSYCDLLLTIPMFSIPSWLGSSLLNYSDHVPFIFSESVFYSLWPSTHNSILSYAFFTFWLPVVFMFICLYLIYWLWGWAGVLGFGDPSRALLSSNNKRTRSTSYRARADEAKIRRLTRVEVANSLQAPVMSLPAIVLPWRTTYLAVLGTVYPYCWACRSDLIISGISADEYDGKMCLLVPTDSRGDHLHHSIFNYKSNSKKVLKLFYE
jgi:hypothetical protein